MSVSLSRTTIRRIIVDLIDETLQTGPLKSGGRSAEPGEDTSLREGILGLDSVALLSVAGRLNSFFHLHEAGTEDYLLRARRMGEWVDLIADALEEGVQAVRFRTSGSTGVPREIDHRLSDLSRESRWLASYLAGRERVIATVAPRHIYGFLVTGMVPDIMDVPVVDGRSFGPRRWREELRSGDLIVSFPEYWSFLEQSLPDIPEEVWGVSSTAPTPPHLIEALRRKGLDGVLEIYGSTETAGVGYRSDPQAPFELFPFWERRGEGIARADREGSDRGRSPDDTDAGDLVELMDVLSWEGPRQFRPLRRRDHAVQVAGTNVFPRSIEERLRERPGVEDVHVRLMRPSEGSRLKAAVVPEAQADRDRLREELEEWIQGSLAAPERPVALRFFSELPRDSMGKLSDW
mgnify:CR=1 FL=1